MVRFLVVLSIRMLLPGAVAAEVVQTQHHSPRGGLHRGNDRFRPDLADLPQVDAERFNKSSPATNSHVS
jgi:hypothetical protein